MTTIIRKRAKDTLTPVELHHGETLLFQLLDGSTRSLRLEATGAEVLSTTLKQLRCPEPGARTIYRFWADVVIEGTAHRLEREVGTQHSFYPPWEIAGLRIWLDAVDAIFDFLLEIHAPCRLNHNAMPRMPAYRHARFAIQDATARICPDRLHPWCPLPRPTLRIEDCYRGEDCWLGAYDGVEAHGGLDINHPPGTPLWAPLDLDDQFLFHAVADGHINNRWRGIRRWPNGSEWILQTCHMIELTVPERQPLRNGQQYARAAGVAVGAAPHTHFDFHIHDEGETYLLDPWILFWQIYQDNPGA